MSIISQVERSAMHRIVGWMKEIIKEKELPFQVDAEIELISFEKKRNFPDILIFSKYPTDVACLIEFKPPFPYDPYDPELVDHTYKEANNAPGNLNGTCRYFGTWNLNKFVLWDKKQYNADSYLDMIYKPYDVAEARNINDITRAIIEESIKNFLKKFLKEFYEIYFDIKPIPTLHIDELFIYRLRTAIDTFSIPISEKIYKESKKSIKFRRDLRKWFSEQGGLFQNKLEDYDKIARQYAYLIVNKVLFYNALRIHKKKLNEIKLDRNLSANEFKKKLQNYFEKALEIDYEPIFAENFLETIPLPDSIIYQLVAFIDSLNNKYNFSSIGYEIIGRVFEKLIPPKERHQLGQYFTRSDVVDLINSFCIKTADDIILDPGCGAATFPIRAYSLIQEKNKSKSHKEILKQLYGIDISKFASHLSMINLSIKDLSEKENYPYILNNDFFDIFPEQIIKRKYKLKKLSGELADIKLPYVDAVVGNPPYTRQIEMEHAFEEKYKEKLNLVIKKDFHFSIGGRSAIYSYFFIHGSIFLKDGGRFGFITSNSWLDTDYGKYLQEFFMNNHKIVAVIESKIERWFEDADINTCITILERCKDEKKRNNNLIKFVQLKIPLSKFITFSMNENERWKKVNKIREKILKQDEFYEDDEIKIYPKNQRELFLEGFDEERIKYIGSKWGKYIRAPDIFFRILKKGKDLFIPLKEITVIKRGITTGANEFFYLTEEQIENLSIEKEFWMHNENSKWIPNYVIKSPKELRSIILNPKDLKHRVLLIHKSKKNLKGTNVLKYIRWGEQFEGSDNKIYPFSERPTCKSRVRWYDLGKREKPSMIWIKGIWERHFIPLSYGAYCDQQLYEIMITNPKINIKCLCSILNSAYFFIIKELSGRVNFGEGILWIATYEPAKMPIIDPSKFNKIQIEKLERYFDKLSKRPIGSVFEEFGTNSPKNVSLSKVKPDRREIDKIIMGEILGLTDNEQLEVYKAVIDLVKSRIERAKSVKKTSKKAKIKLELFAESILEETSFKKLKKFPEDYIKNIETIEKNLPEAASAEIANDLFNGLHIKADEDIVKCSSIEEAKYILYAILNGYKIVKIPKKKEDIAIAVKEYDDLVTKIRKKADTILKEEVKEKKLRDKIVREIEKKIFKN